MATQIILPEITQTDNPQLDALAQAIEILRQVLPHRFDDDIEEIEVLTDEELLIDRLERLHVDLTDNGRMTYD